MAYIGVSPSNGVRQKHTYTATASQTTFSGAGSEGVSLSYRDSNYVDVYRNGVKLGDADYTATSGTSIVLGEGAAVSDIIEIVTYDVFSVADTVSKADGGTFDGNVSFADNTKAIFGDSDDLEIYHDSNDSYIAENGTGNLIIKGTNIQVQDSSGHNFAFFEDTGTGGTVNLYHNASLKLATTSTGIDVTGLVVSDGIQTNTAGTSNFIAGVNAGNSITSGGNFNTVVGDEAGTALTTGDDNTALGYGALYSEDAHGKNTAVGTNSLLTLNAGVDGYNTAVGYFAGRLITTGVRNTLLGALAGDALTDADRNVAIGHASLSIDTQGSKSVAIGYESLSQQNFTSATDSYNTAVGYGAGAAVTTGVENTIIGGLAGDALTDADFNVAIGVESLGTDTQGSKTVAIGVGALNAQNFTSATDSYNTAVGFHAGNDVTTGTGNTLIGGLAGDALTNATNNLAVGFSALSADTLGSRSTAIGTGALQVQNFTSATETYNTAVGYNAGASVTTGIQNIIIGGRAGDSLTDADYNTAVGYQALTSDTRGSRSVAIGRNALQNQNFTSATNSQNTAVGYEAGNAVTTGVNNSFFGTSAGLSNTTGTSNTALGVEAGYACVSGNNVTYVGRSAGIAATGDSNTFVGRSSGSQITSGANNTIVGRYQGNSNSLDIRTQSNRIVLSDGSGNPRLHINNSGLFTFSTNRSESTRKDSTNHHVIHSSFSQVTLMSENTGTSPYGHMIDFSQYTPDNNTNYFFKCEDATAERLFIYSDGDIYNHDGTFAQISDRRIKDNITDANSQWDDIKAMRFVNYQRKDDIRQYGESEAKVQLGLIGQELEAISPNLVRSIEPNSSDIISSSEFGSLYVEGDDIPEGKQVGDVKEVTDKVKGVAYSILYMKAVKALQEAMERIETLEQKVATLEGA